MNSLEALNNFNFIIYNCADTGKVELKLQETNYAEPIGKVLLESFKVIKKDLEILELIQKVLDDLASKYYESDIEMLAYEIEKDLEVLEHLKALFNGYKILEKNGIKYKDMYLLCKNGDDDLIKEWLNEK